MVPDDDQAMVLPCASVMVTMVLLKVAFTCATPEAMFLRSRRRTRVASLPIWFPFGLAGYGRAISRELAGLRRSASSCRRSPWRDPCGCAHWCGCADRGPAGRGRDAGHGKNRGPAAA